MSRSDKLGLVDVPVRAVRRGRAPNCSSSGSMVGIALASLAGAGVVLSVWADAYLRWKQRPEGEDPNPPKLRQGDGLLSLEHQGEAALLSLSPEEAARATKAGALVLPELEAPEGALSAPTEVHLNLTERCPAACTGCYLNAGPEREGKEPALQELRGQLEQLAEMGVFEVAFGGGEVLLRQDVPELAEYARELGLTPNLTTSGFGLDLAVAKRLARVMGQVNVSLDGLGETYRAARGWDGSERGLRAIGLLRAAGVRVGVNTVLSRPLLETPGALEALGQAIARAGAQEWQWLRFKPTGRGTQAWEELAPAPEDLDRIWPRLLEMETATGLAMRLDCALMPFLVNAGLAVQAMETLGVAGGPAGHSLYARDAHGRWSPCSFAAPEVTTPAQGWQSSPTLKAWRERAAAPPEPCASCEIQHICRGGCRVVAAHLAGDALAADPQCPRVRERA